jgi:eukaryotic-like serine/threonine-protein kinase
MKDEGFLDADSEPTSGGTAGPPAGSRPLIRIGPYRILSRIGEGGMGEVYLAEQTGAVRRKVALKIIKLGMSTREVVARFESERQALALMEHPCIARIFDAGATEEGLPYFAMEFVPGVPITQYCDDQQLTTRERLQLFLQVCEAVQHAHHKAIIHRDLKPSNILVALRDGKAIPKIIDFGVAKAVAHPLTEKTVYTAVGQLLGTPRYMSPEQANLTAVGVDTRSDVYSLGVILYELLVGLPLFDPERWRNAGLAEMMRMIREETPVRPSRRLTSLGAESGVSAGRRGAEAATLSRQLRGDLDWIALKALEKEKSRRYGSPGELAADIERYLGNEPVVARPPNVVYRARKFARRHKLAVSALVAVFLILVVFSVTAAVQARRLADERDRANREAQTAREVTEFLTDLFKLSDPMIAQGHQPTARELLDQGAAKIDEALSDQPAVRARLQRTMARAYENLGLYPQAAALYESALVGYGRSPDADEGELIGTRGDLAAIFWRQGRFEEAEESLVETLEARRRRDGDDDPRTLKAANNLANLYLILGRYSEAEPLYLECWETRMRVQGEDHPDTLGAANNLANLYARLGRIDEAGRLYESTYAGRRRNQGENHPDTLGAAANLAEHYMSVGSVDEAERMHRETLDRRLRVLGESHPDTFTTLYHLGLLFRRKGDLDQAERFLKESLEGRRRLLGADHHETLISAYGLGGLYSLQKRFDEARALLESALEGWTRRLGEGHPNVQRAREALGRLLYEQGKFAQAEGYFRRVLEVWETSGGSAREMGETHFNLGCLRALQGDRAGALDHLRRAIDRGFSDVEAFEDEDLRLLRGEPELERLLEPLRLARAKPVDGE